MGSFCESSSNFNDGTTFKKGEQYFNPKADSSPQPEDIIYIDRDRVNLYFSLVNVVDPNQMHSFSISIINNTKLDIKTYLTD